MDAERRGEMVHEKLRLRSEGQRLWAAAETAGPAPGP
jgi:hypothetical protein